MRVLQELEHRLDHRELQPNSPSKVEAGVVRPEVHHFEQELGDGVVGEPGLLQASRRRRVQLCHAFGHVLSSHVRYCRHRHSSPPAVNASA